MKPEAAHCAAVLVAALVLAAGPAQAQEARWRPFISVTPTYEGDADLDQGGDFNVWRAILSGGVARDLGGGNSVGLTLNYSYSDYSFSNPVAFGGVAPWNIVQRYGVAVPLSFALRDGWSVGVIPSVDWFRRTAPNRRIARLGRPRVGDQALRRRQPARPRRRGVRPHREDERIPLPDRRLALQRSLAPHQPARCRPDRARGARARLPARRRLGDRPRCGDRVTRFRLSETGPVQNGVGEERGVPVFLRATRSLDKQMSLHLYAGVVAGGELRVDDSSGNNLRKEDFDPQPFLAATFTARF